MDWSTEFDVAFLGEDAENAKAAAEVAAMCGTWPDAHAMRWRTTSGDAAWLRLTKRGHLTCCAIAPWGDWYDVDFAPVAALFSGEAWPSAWRTKARVGIRPTAPRNDWARIEVGGFACGMVGKTAILCKVIAVAEDGAPRIVQPTLDGPELDASAMRASRWFGLTKWPNGCRALWETGRWQFANYPFLTICAGKAEQRLKAGKPSRP